MFVWFLSKHKLAYADIFFWNFLFFCFQWKKIPKKGSWIINLFVHMFVISRNEGINFCVIHNQNRRNFNAVPSSKAQSVVFIDGKVDDGKIISSTRQWLIWTFENFRKIEFLLSFINFELRKTMKLSFGHCPLHTNTAQYRWCLNDFYYEIYDSFFCQSWSWNWKFSSTFPRQ